jgi:hypothetical protein
MRFDNDPPPLPPNGYLIDDLNYVEEPVAAIAINVALQTMTGYRKLGIGPEYTIVGRKILYSRDSLQAWLAAGGTRGCEERILNPVSHRPVAKHAQPDEREARREVPHRRQQRRRTEAEKETARAAQLRSVEAVREGERHPVVKRKQSANRVMKQAVQG